MMSLRAPALTTHKRADARPTTCPGSKRVVVRSVRAASQINANGGSAYDAGGSGLSREQPLSIPGHQA